MQSFDNDWGHLCSRVYLFICAILVSHYCGTIFLNVIFVVFVYIYLCTPPLLSPVSLAILGWVNAIQFHSTIGSFDPAVHWNSWNSSTRFECRICSSKELLWFELCVTVPWPLIPVVTLCNPPYLVRPGQFSTNYFMPPILLCSCAIEFETAIRDNTHYYIIVGRFSCCTIVRTPNYLRVWYYCMTVFLNLCPICWDLLNLRTYIVRRVQVSRL